MKYSPDFGSAKPQMVVDLLRTLVGNDAAQMHDAVADDDAEALGTPVLHAERIDDAATCDRRRLSDRGTGGQGLRPLRHQSVEGELTAIDQHSAHAGCSHFAEGDRLRVRRHDRRRHPSQKAATVVRWKPVLMCVKLSGGKAASSDVFLASVGARHDKMCCKMVDNDQSYRWFRCCGSG